MESPPSQHSQGDEAGPGVHGQQLSRLETKPLCRTCKLEEVGHATRLTSDLDQIASLHAGRGDFDGGGKRTTRRPSAHWGTSPEAEGRQGQLHAS